MPEAANEIIIHRRIEDVFAFLGNAENDINWRDGVLEIARVSGDVIGTHYRQKVKGPGGRPISANVEITGYKPNRADRLSRRAVHRA
jgi:hypothetical protein